jgi:large subunit ribosomal protein L28
MAARCDICGRKSQYGNRVSHSNRHTKRVFKVNLQHRRLEIDGRMQNVRTCTRCLRTMVKVGKTQLPSA